MEDYKCWHFPIFTDRHQSTIFGTIELNFCVRDGNRCTLNVINTNLFFCAFAGDSWGNRTPVAGVRGRSLDRLTNEPIPEVKLSICLALVHHQGLEPGTP